MTDAGYALVHFEQGTCGAPLSSRIRTDSAISSKVDRPVDMMTGLPLLPMARSSG